MTASEPNIRLTQSTKTHAPRGDKAPLAVDTSPPPTAEAWTIKKAVTWATQDFIKREIASARLEAELLLGHVLTCDRVRLIVDASRPLSQEELTLYRELIVRRRTGEPLAYILGNREFFGHRFAVRSGVLIPRPDTECLVEVALDKTRHRMLDGRALDLCTGSGCVAISFLKKRPTWRVTATDISEVALRVTEDNALALGARWNLRLLRGDLFAALERPERFELITCNPPYIPSSEIPELQREVAEFEPRPALDGGSTGLDFYRRLAEKARAHLVSGGVMAVEVGAGQAQDVEECLIAAGFIEPERTRDLAGHERVVCVRAPRKDNYSDDRVR